ncbi:MAG: hypothetical protein JSV65_05585 [Armatimonadota bacterium]|nr:MAG: hypothetical protein JSV65_05585 [Armatimonadota bacterium]
MRASWLVALVSLCLVGAAVLIPILSRQSGSGIDPCLSNLHALTLVTGMYVLDYGRFPNASTWMDELRPYADEISHHPEPREKPDIFHCPYDTAHRYSYAMNSALSEMKPPDRRNLPHIILFFPSDSGKRNASGLPPVGECRPHGEGEDMCVVAYADGGIAIFAPGERLEPVAPSVKRSRSPRKSMPGVQPRRPARHAEPGDPAK